MVYEFAIALLFLCVHSLLNGAILSGLWQLLVCAHVLNTFKEVFCKTFLSLVIVWLLAALLRNVFCWSAFIMHCLSCLCPVGPSVHQVSAGGMLFFLLSATFVQLTLIAIPVHLSRLLFVLTVIASNTIIILLKLGLSALLV